MDEYLALPDGAGRFSQDFSGPVILRRSAKISCFTSTGLSPSLALLSSQLRLWRVIYVAGPSTLIQPKPYQFGLIPVRSPLLGESLLFSFPSATEMFQLAEFALATYVFSDK